MDAILDLTARAVAVIVLIQDTLIKLPKKSNELSAGFSIQDGAFLEFIERQEAVMESECFKVGGIQINYISLDDPLITRARIKFNYDSCVELINWINYPINFTVFESVLQDCSHYPPPEKWRETIRIALYKNISQRIELVKALKYMPLQIILATGGYKYNAKEQRLLQIWMTKAEATNLLLILSEEDLNVYDEIDKKTKKFKKDEIERFGKLKTTALEYSMDSEIILKKYSASTRKKQLATLKAIDPKYPILSVNDPSVFLNEVTLLEEEDTLMLALDYRDIPLSFLYIFDKELDEICKARKQRQKEIDSCLGDSSKPMLESGNAIFKNDFEKIFSNALHRPGQEEADLPVTDIKTAKGLSNHNYNQDAVQSARELNLWALAFSGGGIRSATFNLGVLQGLTQKGLLGKFDYLSTVSGGGYLGSWFISWIARHKSVLKVADRLNPKKSSDPFAEEVLPIRWLRMYSNYLTPSTGIMSTDSWTVGMTLLRNMLINQVLIAFFLMALITGVRTLFLLWAHPPQWLVNSFGILPFWLMSIVFLLPGTLLAGFGMLSYHKRNAGKAVTSAGGYRIFGTTKRYFPKVKLGVTLALIVLGCIAALIFSAWLNRYTDPVLHPEMDINNFKVILLQLLPVFYSALGGLIIVYIIGRYYSCIPANKRFWRILGDLIGTVIAAIFGLLSILLVCQISYALQCWVNVPGKDPDNNLYLSFTLLPPLVIEVMTITVVTRMALLGSNFPDERREWWGRIGGRVHRISILWMVVMSLIFLGSNIFLYLIKNHENIKQLFVIGWGGSLITGLRVAFVSSNPGDKKTVGFWASFLNWFPLLAPYLFGIAILAYLPDLVMILEQKMSTLLYWLLNESPNMILGTHYRGNLHIGLITNRLILAALLAALAILLGRKIGVNQFSMHLFYKNRLVRAFLGATRLKHERQKSANPFTGFDEKDDLQLKDLVLEKGYFGPYPLINTTANVSSVSVLDRQDRKAESFTFSPHYCGFDFSLTTPAANILVKSYDFAYRPTSRFAYLEGPTLGTAMTISGAAANPNQGYHSNTATAFLLTLFNIRLGWWIGNPRQSKWKNSDPKNGLGYVLSDLGGKSDTSKSYVCLSDGGHFDNMGIYELIRRKCRYIVLSDGEQDEQFSCEGLANAIRRCRIDFGVDIVMQNLDNITQRSGNRYSEKQYAAGIINYPDDSQPGILIYIKASMTGRESADVREYAQKNAAFPHQSTGDQFFDEAQFESYRQLGLHITEELFSQVVH